MKKFNRFCVRAAAVASAFFIGVTPITAFAYVDPAEVEAEEIIPEEPEEDPIEEYGPLTPDGNMELVDDYGTLECGGKQFITVVTKNGNYFYIIIDRDDEGEETVHFLNMVDESDLLSLMNEDEVNEYIALTSDSEDTEEETTVTTTPEPVTEEEETEETTVVEEEKKSNVNGIMVVILLVAVGGVAGYMYYTATKNSKKKSKMADPDEGYVDEPINLQTEEADFDVDASDDVGDVTDNADEDTAEQEDE